MYLYHPNPLSLRFSPEQTHLKSIRPKIGQTLKLTDLKGLVCEAKVLNYDYKNGFGNFDILNQKQAKPFAEKHLIQCIADKLYLDKMMEILPIAKVTKISLISSQFSPKQAINLQRLKLILIRACEQSECLFMPEIEIMSGYLLDFKPDKDLTFLELPEKTDAKNLNLQPSFNSIIVGPEGGFSELEVNNFKKLGLSSTFLNLGVLPAWLAGYSYFIQN